MPKVSVIVPNYNHARFLERRLQSIVEQTFQDFELIILDDASTDGSRQFIQDFAKRRPARVMLNETNTGSPFKQWNRGVREAQGQYVWIAESDDVAAPGLVERLVTLLDDNPAVGVAYCQSWVMDEAGRTGGTIEFHVRDLHPTRWQSDFITTEGRNVPATSSREPPSPMPARSFSGEKSMQGGRGEKGCDWCGDWMTWVKLLLHADIAFSAAPLNYFRCHSQSVRSRTGLKDSRRKATRSERSFASTSRPAGPSGNWLLKELGASGRMPLTNYPFKIRCSARTGRGSGGFTGLRGCWMHGSLSGSPCARCRFWRAVRAYWGHATIWPRARLNQSKWPASESMLGHGLTKTNGTFIQGQEEQPGQQIEEMFREIIGPAEKLFVEAWT